MSIDNFISYLQQLLSMIDPKDKYSLALAKSALTSTVNLAIASGRIDAQTHRAMVTAVNIFDFLAENAADFAGKPGKYLENEKRRHRLLMSISPSC